VAALVGGHAPGASVAVVSGGSLVAAASLAAAVTGGRGAADLCGQAPLGLGAAVDRRRGRHSIVDDYSRYAYSELHGDERAETVTGFVERALARLTELGIEPKRLL
jgi:hypothetical protein